MKTLLFSLLAFCGLQTGATNYFISSSSGSDSRSAVEAQSPSSPWKTLQKLDSYLPNLKAGDTVFFQRGDIFYGSINVASSGTLSAPLVFSSYGNGSQPIITGFSLLNNWQSIGGGIWETVLPVSTNEINMVTVDGLSKPLGRYPNQSDINNGFLTIGSHVGTTEFTAKNFQSATNWTNGEVVIRKNRWVLERGQLTKQSGSTFTYIPASSGSEPADNFGFFFQNHPATLDQVGEWYFDKVNSKLRIVNGPIAPSNTSVKAATLKDLVLVQGRTNIVFENLSFQGSNSHTFLIQSAENISIKNCSMLFSGFDAVYAENVNSLSIQNGTIANSNNSAIICYNGQNTTIRNNVIKNVGVSAGMGRPEGLYTAISITGSNQTLEYNTIDSVGYVPVDFNGDNVLIKNNVINHFGFVKDDGGGIYTWNGFNPLRTNSNRQISGNIILNGVGAGAGTNSPDYAPMHGIYMDDKTGNVDINNNTVGFCGSSGIYLHNAHDLSVQNNTLYGNGQQLLVVSDEYSGGVLIRNLLLKNNILFSRTSDQTVAYSATSGSDLSSMGVFDQNYYCRPADDNLIFFTSYQNNGSRVSSSTNFSQWKSLLNQDYNSRKTPFVNPTYKINAVRQEKFSNEFFNANTSDVSVWSQAGNCSNSWSSNRIQGGTLQVSFSNLTSSANSAYIMFYVGAIEAGKKYLLKFDLLSGTGGSNAKAFLRKQSSPYTTLGNVENFTITDTLSTKQMVFTATSTELNSYIILEVPEQEKSLWIDNFQLYEADVSAITPDNYVKFYYNPTNSAQTFSLDDLYSDMRSTWYSRSITIAPYSSTVLMKPYGMILLPFNFVDVRAATNQGAITLQWKAVNENKIVQYNVEGSSDGVGFSLLGETNSNVPAPGQWYSFNLKSNLLPFYRIRAIDESGRAYYSKVIKADLESSLLLEIKNPTAAILEITLGVPTHEKSQLTIVSANGNLLKTYAVDVQQRRASLNISFLPAGIYFVTLQTGNSRISRQFLKS